MRAADILVLLVHPPASECQPAKAAFRGCRRANSGWRSASPAADHRGDEPHRAPRVRRQPAEEHIVPHLEAAGKWGGVQVEKAVMRHRQVVLDAFPCQIGSSEGWSVGTSLVTSGITATAHFDLPQRRMFPATTASTFARRGDDHAGQAAGVMATAEILHMPVVGADHIGLEEETVIMPDETVYRGRDQEMRVDAFLVHVGDAVTRYVVLDAMAQLLRSAHRYRGAAGVLGARRCLHEDALERDLAITIDVPAWRAAGRRPRGSARGTAPTPAGGRGSRGRGICRSPRPTARHACRNPRP